MSRVAMTWIAGLAVLGAGAAVADAPMPARDPMQPPPGARAIVPAPAGDAPTDVTPRHVMLIDGRRYVIDRGRRLGVGDLLGQARIERIDDGAVWLREGGVLRQVSLFGGIVKRVVAEAAAPTGRPASSPVSRTASTTAASVASNVAPVPSLTPTGNRP